MIDIVVVCEARADAETVQALTDRVLTHVIEWVEPELLDSLRRWVGDPDAHADRTWHYIKWTTIKQRWPRKRRTLHGTYGGRNKGEYLQARKAMLWTAEHLSATRAVILVRDDDRRDRRADFEAARDRATTDRAIALAIAVPEREAWHLVGFDAIDQTERDAIEQITREIGCHPCRQAHTLDPKRDDAPRGTKRVLQALTGGDAARQAACLGAHDLPALAERGEAVGLAAFLDDVSERIAPLISG